MVKSEYPDTFTLTNGGLEMDTTVSVNATSFVEVARHTVAAKQRIFVGNGRINLGVDDRGTYTATVETSGNVAQVGTFKLELEDANAVASQFLRQDRSSDTSSGIKLGKGGRTGNEDKLPFVSEDESILVLFKMDSGSESVTKADSDISLPVTVQVL